MTAPATNQHADCLVSENCGGTHCPAAIAQRKRDEQRGTPWAHLELRRDAGGPRHYVDGRAVHCGSFLELQHIDERHDDYGSYMIRLGRSGAIVRYEANLRGAEPVVTLYAGVGGHEFAARLEAWMRFRWPER